MNFLNKFELKADRYPKCSFTCQNDCEWGEVFDFASQLRALAVTKIQEFEQANQEKKEVQE